MVGHGCLVILWSDVLLPAGGVALLPAASGKQLVKTVENMPTSGRTFISSRPFCLFVQRCQSLVPGNDMIAPLQLEPQRLTRGANFPDALGVRQVEHRALVDRDQVVHLAEPRPAGGCQSLDIADLQCQALITNWGERNFAVWAVGIFRVKWRKIWNTRITQLRKTCGRWLPEQMPVVGGRLCLCGGLARWSC